MKKMQYDINGEAAKTSALSPRKLDKYWCLRAVGILPSNQRHKIEQNLHILF